MIFASRRDSSGLTGRVCLITGGASGIGWALTRALATAGAHVHVCDISQDNLDRAGADLGSSPLAASVTFAHLDVTDRHALEEWINAAYAQHRRIDVLIHNAAYVRFTDVEEMTVEQAQLSMRTGYDALVYGAKTVLPLMRANGSGHIVAMGSSAGRIFVKGPSAAYASTKAAIEAYTEILRTELAGSNIAVTLVRPAAVVGTQFFGVHVPSSRMPRMADFLPPTTPEKVAIAVVKAIVRHRPAVDIPGYLPLFYRAYAMAPELTRKAAATGGSGRRDYATPHPTSRQDSRPRSRERHNGESKRDSLALRALKRAGANARFVSVMSPIAPSIDRATHRLTGGRALLMPARLPSLMLTTIGKVTGRPRQVPLLCHSEPDGSFLVVASNFGRSNHPAWSSNLLATPRATVTRAGRSLPVTATLLEGRERTFAWEQLTKLWPPYDTYARRSGRELKVFRLTPDRP
ncbi:SDR family NAD(P)-dependent oxidoreductase [Streptomyces sp. NPDC040750]|uniref:SDR family NAD(P)-dependent oxidoreductase n=1 Tax=Streptomyces sp. NPDC040750 TaxID=3154491 RepID=UPI0033D67A88